MIIFSISSVLCCAISVSKIAHLSRHFLSHNRHFTYFKLNQWYEFISWSYGIDDCLNLYTENVYIAYDDSRIYNVLYNAFRNNFNLGKALS